MRLRLNPESTATLETLCDDALSAIADELDDAGYTVKEPVKHTNGARWMCTAAIQPGPAELNIVAKWNVELDIQLAGIIFHHACRYLDLYDAVLWDRLRAVQERLVADYVLDSPALDDR